MNESEQYIAAYDPEYTDIDIDFDSVTVEESKSMLRGVEPPPKDNDEFDQFDQFCF